MTMRIAFKTIVAALALVLAPEVALAAGQPLRILALGDSLTAGYGLPASDAFPTMLEHALKTRGLDVSIINAGISGDTSAGGLARLDWSLEDAKNPPAAAIIELGANDGLRGLPVDEMAKNLDAMLARFKARGIPVLFTGMKAPRNYGDAYAKNFDSVSAAREEIWRAVLSIFPGWRGAEDQSAAGGRIASQPDGRRGDREEYHAHGGAPR